MAEGDASSFRLLHIAPIAGGTYSANLIPQISTALQACGRQKSEIRLLVAASGLGSFTGLRVGLSTVKALAEVLQAPIVAVTVLEAIAFAVAKSGLVLSALDAQRGEVYVGEYEIQIVPAGVSPRTEKVQEALASVTDFLTWLGARNAVLRTYTPDATIEKRVREFGLPVDLINRPGAELYARAGLNKFLSGETVAAEELDANYIRRSDAEIFSAPKVNDRKK